MCGTMGRGRPREEKSRRAVDRRPAVSGPIDARRRSTACGGVLFSHGHAFLLIHIRLIHTSYRYCKKGTFVYKGYVHFFVIPYSGAFFFLLFFLFTAVHKTEPLV